LTDIAPNQDLATLTDDALLDYLQRAAFDYFLKTVNPQNGLVADTSRPHSPCSIAVVGFALASYPVGVERGWIAREEAVRLSLAAMRFFNDSEQSANPNATGYKGFYYHFLDMQSGTRVWQSELSMIDTSFLIAGMLTAATYFTADNPEEAALRQLANTLYERVDWRWSQDNYTTIRQGWKPECGYLHYGWEGYSEAILLYVLAMASPTHPIGDDCYSAWTATYQWENLYGHDYLFAGPLFIHHFSHAWIDFRDIRDQFMREKNSDYFVNSTRATHIHREYAQHNPREFAGYSKDCWGFSACDGPTDEGIEDNTGVDGQPRRLFGYAARGVPFGPDDGAISPPAALASLPFAPEIAIEAIRHMITRYPEILTDGRLASSVDPSLIDAHGQAWVARGHFGLDQGIVLMMIENHRNGRIWQWLRTCPVIGKGLRKAGFEGGWLAQTEKGAA
jgi:hypothetical protein